LNSCATPQIVNSLNTENTEGTEKSKAEAENSYQADAVN
jgi:hypothetical protein